MISHNLNLHIDGTHVVEEFVVVGVEELEVAGAAVEDDAARARVPQESRREQSRPRDRAHSPRHLLDHTTHPVLCVRYLDTCE